MGVIWLSVIVPTYNGALFLSETMESLCFESTDGIEFIIVDDGSTDATLEVVKRYKSRLNIQIFELPRSANWAENTNFALTKACAEHVCFLHQDDYWLPGRVAAIREMLAESPESVIYLNSSVFVDKASKRLGKWSCPLPCRPQVISSRVLLERLIVQDFIAICAPVFKRKKAIEIGGLDGKLWYTADWDFWLKMAATGTSLYDARPLTAFRIHNDSQTIRRSTETNDFRYQLECVLERHINLNPWMPSFNVGAARISVEVNVALASLYHGGRSNIARLLVLVLMHGPVSFWIYFKISMIHQRVFSRLKARILNE